VRFRHGEFANNNIWLVCESALRDTNVGSDSPRFTESGKARKSAVGISIDFVDANHNLHDIDTRISALQKDVHAGNIAALQIDASIIYPDPAPRQSERYRRLSLIRLWSKMGRFISVTVQLFAEDLTALHLCDVLVHSRTRSSLIKGHLFGISAIMISANFVGAIPSW
jgi:hypothetical protein